MQRGRRGGRGVAVTVGLEGAEARGVMEDAVIRHPLKWVTAYEREAATRLS